MKAKTTRRLETLERRLRTSGANAAELIQAGLLRPKNQMVVLMRAVIGTPDLRMSKCTRTLYRDLSLMEMVELRDSDGRMASYDGLSKEDLFRWVATFPIEVGS